jgi:hypothetical protein
MGNWWTSENYMRRSCTLCILLILTFEQLNKQDRQCTYNTGLGHVRANPVAVEGNKYYTLRECVCSLSYPEFNAHAPYCHL